MSLTLDHSVFLSSLEKVESQLNGGTGTVRGITGKDTHFENDRLPLLSLDTLCSEYLRQVIIILA
jgi:hypothetical protein